MANRIKRTLKKDDKFFDALTRGLPVRAALDASGYKRRTVYEWRDGDPEFRRRWDEAIAAAVEAMEAEADRRGVEGTLKPVFYQGMECGYIREFSDTLLIFRLKGLRPDKYADRQAVTGAGGGPIQHHHAGSLTPELLAETVHILQTLGTNGHHES